MGGTCHLVVGFNIQVITLYDSQCTSRKLYAFSLILTLWWHLHTTPEIAVLFCSCVKPCVWCCRILLRLIQPSRSTKTCLERCGNCVTCVMCELCLASLVRGARLAAWHQLFLVCASNFVHFFINSCVSYSLSANNFVSNGEATYLSSLC